MAWLKRKIDDIIIVGAAIILFAAIASFFLLPLLACIALVVWIF